MADCSRSANRGPPRKGLDWVTKSFTQIPKECEAMNRPQRMKDFTKPIQHRARSWSAVLTFFFAASLGNLSYAQEESQPLLLSQSDALNAEVTEVKATARDLSSAFRSAAERILPAVVVVLAKRSDVNETLDQLQLLDETASNFSAGSGVIIREDGLIVTNNHVVENSKSVRIRLPDGREFLGTDIKRDPASDLAILRISVPEPLKAATIGDSSLMAVGDWVIAVGSPFLLEQTVSAGIISGKARILKGMVSGQLLQTDASINPGNSGGALANLDGELIAINSAIVSGSGTFQGVGFAIPTKRVQWIVSELETRGAVRRASLGVTTVQLPQAIAMKLNLPIRDGGAYVARVRSNSPASKAGLQTGDVILQVAEQNARSPTGLAAMIEQSPIGQPVILSLIRNEKRIEVSVELEARD